MNPKNRRMALLLVLLAVVGVVLLAYLFIFNEPDSAIKALEPDPMHQPSTN